MKRALVITAYDRPGYLKQVLKSWAQVQGLKGWSIIFSLEPSPRIDDSIDLIRRYMGPTDLEYQVVVNDTVLGVLLHPWVVFEETFAKGYDFVVRGEDDLLVSRDILPFFDFASTHFQNSSLVAAVNAYVGEPVEDDRFHVSLTAGFNPWVWGTWTDRWQEYIGPTWDKDYSTYNGAPGVQAGWDWNLNTRVLPRMGKMIARPSHSRVQNIGVHGVHGTPDNFAQAAHWLGDYGRGDFWSDLDADGNGREVDSDD